MDTDTEERQAKRQDPGFTPTHDIWAERFKEIADREERGTFDEIIGANFSDGDQGATEPPDEEEEDEDENGRRRGIRIINDNADDPQGSRDNVKGKEENTDWDNRVNNQSNPQGAQPQSMMGKLQLTIKKGGPSASIAGIVVGGGVTASFVLSPGLILVHVKEIFHNDRSDATRTNQIYARAFLNYKFGKTDDKCGQGKSKIMCKLGTMSKSQLKEYRDAGFKVKGEEVDKDGNKTGKDAIDADTEKNDPADKDKRYSLTEIEFPDGHKSNSGKDAFEHGDKNPNMLRRLTNAFNPKSKYYQNKKFSKMLTNVLKIKKGKAATTYPEGDDEEAQRQRDEQFNSSTGGTSEADAGNEARRLAGEASDDAERRAVDGTEGEQRNSRPKTGGYSSILRMFCTGYKTVKIGVASVQYYHYLKLAGFAMEFLKVADMIKAGAAVAVAVDYITTKLTYTGPYEEEEKNGLAATDAQGYKMAAHGDMTGLMGFAQKYVLGGADGSGKAVTTLLAAEGAITAIELAMQAVVNAANPGDDIRGRDAIRWACRAINGQAALVAQCAAAGMQIVTATTATTGPGGIAGAAIAAKMCQCTLVPQKINKLLNSVPGLGGCEDLEKLINAAEKALAAALGVLVAKAAEKIIENWNIGSDTKGVDAGNALAAGAGLMLSTAATSYALKPGTKTNYKEFVAYTDTVNEKYENLAREDAKLAPFDVNNRYSFISKLGKSIKTDDFSTSPLVKSFGTLFSVIPSAISAINTKAHGLYSAPVEEPVERYDCNTPDEIKNEDLDYLGVDGDKFCSIIPYTPTKELEAVNKQATTENDVTFSEVIEYMTNEQKNTEGSDITSVSSITCDGECQGGGTTLASGTSSTAQLSAAGDGGTKDDSQGCDSECEKNSMERSVDPDTGKTNEKGQLAKFEKFCTDERVAQKIPWGASGLAFDVGSIRDQDWSSGKQCLKESKMLTMFRMWHNICSQGGTADGTSSCFEDDMTAAKANTNCGDGTTESIYDCALQFDPYGYLWGGGHGGSAEEFMKKFDAGEFKEGQDAILDCSGLVRMAIYEAMGVDIGGISVGDSDGSFSSPHIEEISASEAKKGDLIAAPGHIEIIGGAGSSNSFPSFGAHTSGIAFEEQISVASYEGTRFYRFKE